MQTDDESRRVGQAARMGNPSAPRLHGRWLLLARIAWLGVAALCLSLFLLGLLPYAAQLHTVCPDPTATSCPNGGLSPAGVRALQDLGISVEGYIWYTVVMEVLTALVWASVGLLIFWHRSAEGMAWLTALFLVIFTLILSGGPASSLVQFSPLYRGPLAVLGWLGEVLFGLFLFLFPNGRFVPRWIGWVLVVSLGQRSTRVFVPPNSPLNAATWPAWLNTFFSLMFLGTALFSLIYRYRRILTATERQQTKWVLFGSGVVLVGGIALSTVIQWWLLPSDLYNLVGFSLWNLLFLAIPLSIGMAMLRSRLWEIDVIISRTLVYGSLTALLALLYFGLIFALQSLTHALTGQAGENPIVIVASTLAIAALFQPLRHRLQALIDQRFYRRKYDAAKTLQAFSTTLRQEVDLEQLREHLLAVVQETMQPRHVSLWLRPPEPTRKHHMTSSSSPLLPEGGEQG